jgi:hypothetical protein
VARPIPPSVSRQTGRLGLALLTAALALIVGAGPVAASHAFVGGTLWVLHGDTTVSSTSYEPACSDTTCLVTIPIGKRDYNRFQRWCGPNESVTIPASSYMAETFCYGPSAWSIQLRAVLYAGDGYTSTTHTSPVTVTFYVQVP